MASEDPWKAGSLFPCSLPSSFAPGTLCRRDVSLDVTVGNRDHHGPILLKSSLVWASAEEAGSLPPGNQSLAGETAKQTWILDEVPGPLPNPAAAAGGWADFIFPGGSLSNSACFDSRRHRQSAFRGGAFPNPIHASSGDLCGGLKPSLEAVSS